MRLTLFEVCDQVWCPGWLRELIGDLLRHQSPALYEPALPLLEQFLSRADANAIVDLCSGGGGPWPHYVNRISADVNVVLTDVNPRRNNPTGLLYEKQSVDACCVPTRLHGARTMYTAFHHFSDSDARRVLSDAVRGSQGIAIFEFTSRRWTTVAGMLFSPIVVAIQTPFIRPLTWTRIVFTYLLPLVPLVYLWDGAVSHLRSRTLDELNAIAADESLDDFRWDMGTIPNTNGGPTITYLIGLPKDRQKQL